MVLVFRESNLIKVSCARSAASCGQLSFFLGQERANHDAYDKAHQLMQRRYSQQGLFA